MLLFNHRAGVWGVHVPRLMSHCLHILPTGPCLDVGVTEGPELPGHQTSGPYLLLGAVPQIWHGELGTEGFVSRARIL